MSHLAPGTAVGGYIVEASLGTGGMASVYRVRHAVLDSVHALKVLRPDLVAVREVRDRFLDEGRVLASFRHPSLVRVTEVVAEPGVAGLVMDYLQGEDLAARIAREGPASVSQAAAWVSAALEAMAHAHARGVIHRDLKPANLFLAAQEDGSERLTVLDFGVAKVLGQMRMQTQGSLGTWAYMSPEQIEAPGKVDHRTDIFSMGVVLYEFVSGVLPFDGETDFDTARQVVACTPTPIRALRADLPEALTAVLERAMQRDPAHRYPDCGTFAHALAPLMEKGPRSAFPPPLTRGLPTLDPEDEAFEAPPVMTAPVMTAPSVTAPVMTASQVTAPVMTAPSVTAPVMTVSPGTAPVAVTEEAPARAELLTRREALAERELLAREYPMRRDYPLEARYDAGMVRTAALLQVVAGALNLTVMWAGGCLALGSAAVVGGDLLGLGQASSLCGCLGSAALLLIPLGIAEVIVGLQGIILGRSGRGAVAWLAWLELLSLGVGGLTSALVGAAALLLANVKEAD